MIPSLHQKIGQLMFIGVSGHTLTADEKDFIVENNIGGVVLFGRNCGSPEQVHALCTEIQNLRHQQASKAPIFIGIDMEGGRVARLKAPFTIWPPVKKLGELNQATATFHLAKAMGTELLAAGINLDFAPCVDIYNNPKNTVIGDRAFGSTPEVVEVHASAMVRGYIKSGILSCAKHFPGHGHTLIDSHLDLPVATQTLEDLENLELRPFKRAAKAKVEFMMMAHILFEKIDPKWPATLSPFFVDDLLKKQFRFRGLVITDDLGMKALSRYGDVGDVAVQALKAGVDMLLYCNEPEAPPIALEAVQEAVVQNSLPMEKVEEAFQKVIQFKKDTINNPDPMPWSEAKEIIGSPAHLELADAVKNLRMPDLPEETA